MDAIRTNKLKGKIVEKGMNVETLAKLTDQDKTTFYRKLGDIEKFTVGDVNRIKRILELTTEEACDIFIE